MLMKGFEFPEFPETEEENATQNVENIVSEDTREVIDDVESSNNQPISEAETNLFNTNPYNETIINENPYQNVNIEDVISLEPKKNIKEKEEEETPEEKIIEKDDFKPQSILSQNYSPNKLSEDDLTTLEINRIKEERKLKLKNARTIFVIVMFVFIVTIMVAYNRMDKNKERIKIDPVNVDLKDKDSQENLEFSAELNNYYQTREKTNIEKILVDNANNPEKITEMNNTVLNQIDKLIDDIVNSSTDSTDYDKKMADLNDYLTSLNAIKFNDVAILKDMDYNSIKDKLSRLKEDSLNYFTGLNYYNAKDYNNAYETFNSIPEDNYFNKIAKKNMDKIQKEIIELLEKDIKNLSTNLEYLDQAEKKLKYVQIKSIIEQYNNAYPYLHLDTNQRYNDLLQKYSELSK